MRDYPCAFGQHLSTIGADLDHAAIAASIAAAALAADDLAAEAGYADPLPACAPGTTD